MIQDSPMYKRLYGEEPIGLYVQIKSRDELDKLAEDPKNNSLIYHVLEVRKLYGQWVHLIKNRDTKTWDYVLKENPQGSVQVPKKAWDMKLSEEEMYVQHPEMLI